MPFIFSLFCFLLASGLITESVLTLLIMRKLKNNRQYIYKFLMSNKKQRTLEQYVSRTFIPRYIFTLFVLLDLSIVLHYTKQYSLIYLLIFSILIFLRSYNRNVFSTVWEVFTKLSYRD